MSRTQTVIAITATVLMVAVAVATGTAMAAKCMDAVRLKDAAVVDASILQIERETKTAGDGSTEFVHVTYAYNFEGQRYQHRTRRLTLFGKSSSLHVALERAMNNNQPVACYVSKTHPSLSVFSRQFSISSFAFSLILPLGFGTASILAARGLITSIRAGRGK